MKPGGEAANGRFVVSGDIRLWTVIGGSGRRLLIVHGGPGLDHTFVSPLANELSSTFEVWTPDLPGHGRSLREDGKTPGLRQLEDKLVNWIDHLPFRFDAIIGHSLGAWLVRESLRHGHLDTGAAILVSPPGSGQVSSRSSLRRVRRVTPAVSGDPDFRKEIRLHVEAECGGQLPPEAREIIERSNLTHISRYRSLLVNLHKHITSAPRPFEPSCPVLVVVGSEDRTTPVEQAGIVANAVAGSRLEVLEELGHYPFFQDPGAVATVIREFIAHELH